MTGASTSFGDEPKKCMFYMSLHIKFDKIIVEMTKTK